MGEQQERQANSGTERKTFPATVVRIVNRYTLVINRGHVNGIKNGQRFLIYRLSEDEITDPETGENLGRLETVKGTGTVIHAQERISTVESDKRGSPTKSIIRRNPLFAYGVEEMITPSDEIIPFHDPQVGDRAKPI